MSTIHLMHGKQEKHNIRTTKTGCRLNAEHRQVTTYVFWNNREHVTCEDCLDALMKLERLHAA